MNTEDVLNKLSKPFHPSHLSWKPGATNKDKTKALALAYADIRAYQNRLDEVCGMNWAVSYTPWGDRIVCHLTINGITRSSTGEADAQSERSEIAGTSAEAQAFKRACAMFGLGRYIYNMPSMWVEYSGNSFTEQGKAKLQSIVVQHYKRNMDGEESTPMAPGAEDSADRPLVTTVDNLGKEVYGDQWPSVRDHNIDRITEGKSTTLEELTDDSLNKLIKGLNKLKAQKEAAPKA